MPAPLSRDRLRSIQTSSELRSRRLYHRVREMLGPRPTAAAAISRLRREGGVGPADVSPTFVLGAGWRTGSTLMQRMLNQTGELLVWGEPYSEGAIAQRLVESLAFLDPEAGRFHGQVLPDDGQVPGPSVWTANMTPPLPHLVAAQRAMLDRLWGLPAHQHGCPRWGVKEVVWGRDVVDLLTVLYPAGRFVLIVRDPVSQWRSYRPVTHRPWPYRWPERPIGSPGAFGRMWRDVVGEFLAVSREVPQSMLVRYEDLHDPGQLEKLTSFLELSRPLTTEVGAVGPSARKRFYAPTLPHWETALIRRITAATAKQVDMPEKATPPISVIIRVKDKVDAIGAAIDSVRTQTVAAEIIVVDSGSTDGTLELVRSRADRVVEIPAEEFTFGRALNIGAAAASAPLHVALSSHCVLPHSEWLARVLSLMRDERIGAVGGKRRGPHGGALEAPVHLDAEALRARPRWSLSNHASAWRAQAWRHCPFNEDLTASEDLLFAQQITERGWRIVIDPVLFVRAIHRRSAGALSLFRRRRLEVAATARAFDLPVFGWRDAWRWWWSQGGLPTGPKRILSRLHPMRAVNLAGQVAGYRDAGKLDLLGTGRRTSRT